MKIITCTRAVRLLDVHNTEKIKTASKNVLNSLIKEFEMYYLLYHFLIILLCIWHYCSVYDIVFIIFILYMITDVMALTPMVTHAIQCFQCASAKGITRRAMLLQVLYCLLAIVQLSILYAMKWCAPDCKCIIMHYYGSQWLLSISDVQCHVQDSNNCSTACIFAVAHWNDARATCSCLLAITSSSPNPTICTTFTLVAKFSAQVALFS
jgi:hypothetical protein